MTEQENNKLVKAESEIIEKSLEDYGVQIKPFAKRTTNVGKTIIPIPKSLAADLTVALQRTPEIISNAVAHDALNNTAYTITFNGKNVLPDQLWQKSNGSFISNLKGEGRNWGKQTDIDVLDNSTAMSATVVSSVFAVAAVATSMYYMKNINDKLAELQEETRSILEFLEYEKQSQIETDMNLLKELADNMEAIKNNPSTKQIKMNQFSAIQREAHKNVRFYEKQIRSSLEKYIHEKKAKKNRPLGKLKSDFEYYRICLFEYAISKLIEIQLTDTYETSQLTRVRKELEVLSERHKDLIYRIITRIDSHHKGTIEAKALRGISSSLDFMGDVVRSTPLRRTDLDEAFDNLGEKSGNVIRHRTKRITDQIASKEDGKLIDPVIRSIIRINATYNKPLELVYDGKEAVIKIKA